MGIRKRVPIREIQPIKGSFKAFHSWLGKPEKGRRIKTMGGNSKRLRSSSVRGGNQ